jgi:hypothetical protein
MCEVFWGEIMTQRSVDEWKPTKRGTSVHGKRESEGSLGTECNSVANEATAS